jgi:hypothetical protein
MRNHPLSLLLVLCAACTGCGGTGAFDNHQPDAAVPAIVDNHDGTFTLTMGPFAIAPGEERYLCQDFANPFAAIAAGGDAAIARFDSHLTPGAHHLLLFYKPGAADRALETCSGTEFAAGPYGSQRSDDSLAYPAGVAAAVPAGTGFRVQAHYLNASAARIDATVTIRMSVAPAASVRDHAAVLFLSNLDLHIPAGAHAVVAEKRCTIPFDVNLIQSTGHMHRHGTHFTASTPTAALFDTVGWQDVAPALYDPPLHLAADTPITFRCTYDNDGTAPIGYGESAATDEMCIFSAQFYPAPFGGWSCF